MPDKDANYYAQILLHILFSFVLGTVFIAFCKVAGWL